MPNELFDFQSECVTKLTPVTNCLIGDDMGLGKTVEAIVLDRQKRERYGKAFAERGKVMTLIITPMSVMGSWKRHLASWQPGLKVYAIDPKAREAFVYAAQKGNADVFLCHWDALRLMPELKKILWFHIIGDEIHRIKNRKAQVTIAIKSLYTHHRLGLSGTAADNKPGDLWSILNWLYPRKWSSEKRFHDKHVLWKLHTAGGDCQAMNNETGDVCGKYHRTTFKEILGTADVEELLAEMEPFYVRRLKEDVLDDLPEKYYTEIPVELGPQQRRAYEGMRQNMLAWVGEHESEPIAAPVIVAQLMRLQQFSLGYAELVDVKVRNADGDTIIVPKVRMTEPSAKLDTLMEIIGDNPNEQIGVFSQFKQSINMLARRLDAARISCAVLTGDTKEKDRDRVVQEFQQGERRVFAGTIGAGGEGIELTAASTGVFLDRAWNPSKNRQAEDRFHRIGQKNAVQIIDLVAGNTIDAQRNAKIQLKWSWLREILGDTVRRSNA